MRPARAAEEQPTRLAKGQLQGGRCARSNLSGVKPAGALQLQIPFRVQLF